MNCLEPNGPQRLADFASEFASRQIKRRRYQKLRFALSNGLGRALVLYSTTTFCATATLEKATPRQRIATLGDYNSMALHKCLLHIFNAPVHAIYSSWLFVSARGATLDGCINSTCKVRGDFLRWMAGPLLRSPGAGCGDGPTTLDKALKCFFHVCKTELAGNR